MAIDVGVGAVVNNWEFGFGANGLANRIEWSDAVRTSYFHANLLTGDGELTEGVPVPVGDVRVELPVDYRANVGYDVERWAAVAEFGRGMQGEPRREPPYWHGSDDGARSHVHHRHGVRTRIGHVERLAVWREGQPIGVILLHKRPTLARCYVCHSQGTPLVIRTLSPGRDTWTEEESRKNFEVIRRVVVPGDPRASRLLMMPLAAEAGGIAFHPGGKHWASQDDPEWRTLADWVRGAK